MMFNLKSRHNPWYKMTGLQVTTLQRITTESLRTVLDAETVKQYVPRILIFVPY